LDGFLGLYIDEDDVAGIGPGTTVYIESRPLVLRGIRRTDRGYQVAFVGVDSREQAEAIRGLDVEVESRRNLGPNEFWPGDLIGLAVHIDGGERVGQVVDVIFGSAQERLMVEATDGSRFEVPFVDDLVPVVDLERGRVEVVPLPGLIEP
jgi:16S rRNA processing protein RimM